MSSGAGYLSFVRTQPKFQQTSDQKWAAFPSGSKYLGLSIRDTKALLIISDLAASRLVLGLVNLTEQRERFL